MPVKKALTGRYKKAKDKTTTNNEAGQEPRNDGQQLGRGAHAGSRQGRACGLKCWEALLRLGKSPETMGSSWAGACMRAQVLGGIFEFQQVFSFNEHVVL
jgi:hypothetical protein